MQQAELARQFAQAQQQRYGEQYQHDVPVDQDDEDAAAEAELARQFAQTQQQRYILKDPLVLTITCVLVLWIFVLLNIVGPKMITRVQAVATVLALIPIVGIAVFG